MIDGVDATANPPMRKIGYVLGALALLVALALVALGLLPGAWVAERAERFAADSLGIPLEIGDLELDLLSTTPGARARDVSLGDGQGGTIVTGADVELALDAGSLAGTLMGDGEPVVERLSLSGADIDLVIDENGRGNWESLLPEADDAEAAADVAPSGIPKIRSLEIDDVSLDLDDARSGRSISLTLSGRGSTTDPERPLELEARGEIDGSSALADITLAPRGEPFAGAGSLGVESTLRIGDTALDVTGTVGDPATLGELDLSFALEAPDAEDVAPLVERFVDIDVPPLPAVSVSGALASGRGDWLLRDVEARFGALRLSLSGAIDDPLAGDAAPENLDPRIDFALEVPNLDDVEALLGTSLPALPAIGVAGKVRRDGDDWVLRRFDANVGESVLEGDVRVDPGTTPLTLFANVIVGELHLDELADLFGDAAEEDVPAGTTERTPLERDEGHWFPDEPLELRSLARLFDGAVRLRVREIVSDSIPLDAFAARLEVDGDELSLSSLKIGVGGGTVGGGIELDTGATPPDGIVELRVRGVDLKRIAIALGIDDDSFGTIGGRAKYWVAGDSIASLLGGADGGLFLAINGGGLDALLVELAGLDLVESIVLAIDPGKTLTRIDCGYVDLQSVDGITDIATFVLETADTVFVADGTIDLAAESFDIVAEPHPKDVSLIDLSTAVRVRGRPGVIDVQPGGEIGARSVVAASLAAVVAPAAALFAFVERGDGRQSPYCEGLADAL